MRHFKILLLLLLPIAGTAQQRKTIDSLLAMLEPGKDDTVQVNRLNSVANNYTVVKPDSNIFYSTKALELSKKLHYKKGEAHASQILSSGYKIKGEYPLAWEYLQYAKKLYSELKDQDRVLFMEFGEGTLTREQGDDTEALAIFLRLKPRMDKPGLIINSQDSRLMINNNLANAYLNLNQPDSAILYGSKAFDLIPDKMSYGSDYPLAMIGDAYFLKGEFDSALKYHQHGY